MTAYTAGTLFAQNSAASVGMRNTREIQTVSWALDLLVMGELAQLGDVLMQRYKALEASVSDGGWHLARHYELIPPTIA